MTNRHEQPEPANLDAFLDGQLSASDREEFLRALSSSHELRATFGLQSRIDASLSRRFLPPPAPAELLAKLRDSAEPHAAAPRPRRRLMLAAAAIFVAVSWGGLMWQLVNNQNGRPHYNPRLPLTTIYRTRVQEGFQPTWLCDNEGEFAETFFNRQGQALRLAALPDHTKMTGLTYCGGLSRYTTTMLARVDGKPVMVFVDRATAEKPLPEPSGSTGLHIFHRQAGPLVFYEVTPLDRPRVMDFLELIDPPPQNCGASGGRPPADR